MYLEIYIGFIVISGLHKKQKMQENKGSMGWQYAAVYYLFLV